jgi:hypothetical protein
MVVVRSGMVDLVGEVLVAVHMGAVAAVEVALVVLAHCLTSAPTTRVPSLLVDPAVDDHSNTRTNLTAEKSFLAYFNSRAKST